MFFISLNIDVFSYAELFWHLLVNRSKPTGPIVETVKPPPIIAVPDQAATSLFALIIGINEYNPKDLNPLDGCVKDATDVRNYLLQDLKVPDSHIRFLINANAKRADIIKAFLEIQTDKRIKKNDPILIFFAGHGDETDAPTGWPSGDVYNQIQMIIPQDYSTNRARQVHGIPDHTLAALLNGIAKEHGDDITVIFDCCHSGSGTRGRRKVRGLTKNQSQHIPQDLDRDIWYAASGSRGSSTAPGYTRRGLSNHVLLAACTQKEEASDGGTGGGAFTQALLPTLKSVGADKLTYASLLERMDKIPDQNPQCEGVNQHRIIFDSKAPTTGRVCFPIKLKGNAYEMQAGSAHGVTEGSEFSLYNDSLTIDNSPSLCVFVVAKAADIGPFTTTLQIKSTSSAPVTILSATSCVLQTKAGEAEDLLLFAPLDENLLSLYETLAKMIKEFHPGKRQIRPVLEKEKARLGLSIVKDRIAFDILDPRLAEYGLTRMPHTVANDPQEIIPVLHGAAHYYWHLNREVKDALVNTSIDIECKILKPTSDYDSSGNAILKPTGDNLLQLGVIDVVASAETMYGYKITNNSARDLYVNAFYFDNTDFSIESIYQSPTSGKFKTYPTLPKNGNYLTLGYGSGGVDPFTYQLEEGTDIDVGYLLFFISSENVNLSTIPQKTPFEGPGRKSVPVTPPAKPIYGTILVPIVQRRYPVQGQ